mgnify:CR=1 FL=1
MISGAIYSILSGNAAVAAIVGTKIYPEIAPQGDAMPFIVYQIQSALPETTKDSTSKLDTYQINIICFGNDYDVLFTLEAAVRTAIDRYKGTVSSTNIDQANFKGMNSGYDETANVFINESEYSIRVKL